MNASLPISSLIWDVAVIDILFIPMKYPFMIDPMDIKGISKDKACNASLQSGFFSMKDVKTEDSESIIIIDNIVIENRMVEVVIMTFFTSFLPAISLAITTGSDSWVKLIKNIIVGLIIINNPVASSPTTLVVVTFAIVAIIFTITLSSIKEIIDLSKGLFFKK